MTGLSFRKEIGRVVDFIKLVEFSMFGKYLIIDQRMYLDNFVKTGQVFFIGVPTPSLYGKFNSEKSRPLSWTYIKDWLLITQVKIIRS